MADTFRETFAGQIIYRASGGKLLKYVEERDGFQLPRRYQRDEKRVAEMKERKEKTERNKKLVVNPNAPGYAQPRPPRRSSSSEQTAVAEGETGEEEDPNLVDWYDKDDPENPQNWSKGKKLFTTGCLCLMTTSVYMGSSIVSPAIEQMMVYFGRAQVPVTLVLSMFVAGYAIGPLVLSPLTEIPAVGRTIPYIITLAIFVVLQVPTALVTNFGGILVLRFLAGFVGSPPLATGGASIQDIWAPEVAPNYLGVWGLSAAAGPALAPVVASFAVQAKGWRWAFWEMLWLSGFSLIVLTFTLPETSSINILVRRAQRLRKVTGNKDLTSAGEKEQASMTGKDIVMMTLVRPLQMTFTEPIILACNLYLGFIYAILYSWFESFPLVFGEMGFYGWSLGVSTLPFLSIMVGSVIGYIGFAIWMNKYYIPKYRRNSGKLSPEHRMYPALVGCWCFPICLFWFAWSSGRTSWVSPVIAAAFFGIGTTLLFMSVLNYISQVYAKYAASALASNDFTRSMMGAGMPLAAHGLFVNLGVNWGSSLLGFVSLLFIPIPFVLIKFGPKIRGWSKMAEKDEEEVQASM